MQILNRQVWVGFCISSKRPSDACAAGPWIALCYRGTERWSSDFSMHQKNLKDMLKHVVGPCPQFLIQ